MEEQQNGYSGADLGDFTQKIGDKHSKNGADGAFGAFHYMSSACGGFRGTFV